MTADRSFRLHDTSIYVNSVTGEMDRRMNWPRPDYETFNRVIQELEAKGFKFGKDPWIDSRWPSLNKSRRLGQRATPVGDLFVKTEVNPISCEFEFFQEVVTENRSGGRFDFDKRRKMPYLIGKAFEVALRAARAHLVERGFTEVTKLETPLPDPLAYFNDRWDSEGDRKRGVHRFRRDESGWPEASELTYHGRCDGAPILEQGSTWYYRDFGGHLMRGQVYGGINGMWTVVYGPGRADFTTKSRHELFQCSPSAVPRRLHPRAEKRLEEELAKSVTAENFERAIVLRDQLKRAA